MLAAAIEPLAGRADAAARCPIEVEVFGAKQPIRIRLSQRLVPLGRRKARVALPEQRIGDIAVDVVALEIGQVRIGVEPGIGGKNHAFLRVRDVVEMAVSESTLRLVGEKLRRTKEMPLTGDPVAAVEVLAQRQGLTETERAGVLRSLIEGGDLSGFGLVNAVTHFPQQVADYDRATELEALGGRLVECPASDWKSLGVEA